METTHQAQKYRLTKYDKPPYVAKALPRSFKPYELEKSWVSFQVWSKNMLILEYGDKIMEDGLATKDSSFLVD